MVLKTTRRSILKAPLAAPALIATTALAAPAATEGDQISGWYRFSFGAFEITILSDGSLSIPTAGLGANRPAKEVQSFLATRFLDPNENYAHTNHVLIDTGEAKVLVDVGSGERFQPSAGRLLTNMVAAGVDPSDITHVALTHAHPDHVWGMLDEFDELRFPEASYLIGAAEFDWWMADDRVDQVAPEMQGMVVGAQNALSAIRESLGMAKDGIEIASGVSMIDTFGHTVGHMSVLIESEGDKMLIVGDAISHGYVSFEHPDWHGGFDMDKDRAVATRKRLLDMAAADRLTVSGYHLPFPGVGHVVRDGNAYRFIPIHWRWGG